MNPDPPIHPLTQVEEFESCVALQTQVWGFADRDLVPRRMFVVAHKTGGQILGAWDGGRLIAFAMALPGSRDGRLYWHSHMLAVADGYRNRGLGRRLKLRQRDEALARNIDLMEWTFDPLESKNAYFNIVSLGTIARRYHPNLYGLTSSALQAGLPTDRLTAEWWLSAPRVVQLASDDELLPLPHQQEVAVPPEIQAWKSAADPRAAAAQAHIREALLTAFAQGLAVVGFRRQPAAFLLAPLEGNE